MVVNSLYFLKELVSEPSNIIYPKSFVKRSLSQMSKKNINIKTLNKNNIRVLALIVYWQLVKEVIKSLWLWSFQRKIKLKIT